MSSSLSLNLIIINTNDNNYIHKILKYCENESTKSTQLSTDDDNDN